MAVLALKTTNSDMLLMAEEHVVREVMHLVPLDGLTVITVLRQYIANLPFTIYVCP